MKILFLSFIVFFGVYFVDAQGFVEAILPRGPSRAPFMDNLSVERDARLDKMLKWHIAKNEEREGMEGFRVEVFFSSNLNAREQALKTKTEFLSEHPEYPVHIKFVAPNFRVRVGDFRTKNEAWKLYKKIQKEYPTAFVVPDIINFPQLKAKQNE